jgi:hypothetical protein
MRKKVVVSVASCILAALWSAPLAHAIEWEADGAYSPNTTGSTQPTFSAHVHVYGHPGMDLSEPSGTLTMSNGCTMLLYGNGQQYNDPSGFSSAVLHSHVTSGAGQYCRDSSRIHIQGGRMPNSDQCSFAMYDLANGGSWFFNPNKCPS